MAEKRSQSSRAGQDSDIVFGDPIAGNAVDRVAVRLPPFWPEDPEVWFAQAEAQFHISGIKDDTTKFYQVIAQLENRYARELKDLIKNPPTENKYEKLKTQLIKRLSSSRELQISQLLAGEELGDRKPSQFLRHLQTLAADGVTEEFMRGMWSNRLPTHVQAIIVSQKGSTLEEVAELADKICEIAPAPAMQVASTALMPTPSTSSSTPVHNNNAFDSMLQKLDGLISSRIQMELQRLQIAQLSIQDGRPRFRRNSTRSPGRYRSRSQSRSRGMCWYHYNFGDKARKCTSPCNYAPGNKSDSQ